MSILFPPVLTEVRCPTSFACLCFGPRKRPPLVPSSPQPVQWRMGGNARAGLALQSICCCSQAGMVPTAMSIILWMCVQNTDGVFTSQEVTIRTPFYCIQGYRILLVPLIRGPLNNFSPPAGLGSFVKPEFADRERLGPCSISAYFILHAAECLGWHIWS